MVKTFVCYDVETTVTGAWTQSLHLEKQNDKTSFYIIKKIFNQKLQGNRPKVYRSTYHATGDTHLKQDHFSTPSATLTLMITDILSTPPTTETAAPPTTETVAPPTTETAAPTPSSHTVKTSAVTSPPSTGRQQKNLGAHQAAKFLGVTGRTLRRWHELGYINAGRTPGNQRVYDINSIVTIDNGGGPRATRDAVVSPDAVLKLCARKTAADNFIYARVSSAEQHAELERQVQTLSAEFHGFDVISDVGSGLDFKRPGLQKLIKRCVAGNVGSVVVAGRDTLSRIAFDLFQFLFKSLGIKLVVHTNTKEDHASRPAPAVVGESQLGEDLMLLVHAFSNGHYGKRRYTKRKVASAVAGGDVERDAVPSTPQVKRGPGRPRKFARREDVIAATAPADLSATRTPLAALEIA